MLEKLLKSKTEAAILGVVLFSESLHLREIARRAGTSAPQARTELENLASIGVLEKSRKGNLSIYSSNAKCPFLSELKGIYLKTEGAAPLLAKKFAQLKGIKYVFIYGSTAGGNFTDRSDIDVLLVGNTQSGQVERICGEVQNATLKEINYILWSETDFRKKLKEKGAFISSIMKNKRLWLEGDEDEFGRLAKKTGNRAG